MYFDIYSKVIAAYDCEGVEYLPMVGDWREVSVNNMYVDLVLRWFNLQRLVQDLKFKSLVLPQQVSKVML